MTDIDALLPCPMCGDEARVCQWKDTVEPNATWIECPNCSVMTDTFYDPSPDEAIRNAASVWNRRVPLSADALTAERAKVAALVRAHLTSDEAVARGGIAAWRLRNASDASGIIRAAILAALGEGE